MKLKALKKGDPCPCCGQPIQTDDSQLLRILELFREIIAAEDETEEEENA